MRDRDYYPAGAYNDPNAPYNEFELPDIEVTATVNIAMTKDIVVTTDQYTMDEEGRTELLTSYSDIEKLIGKQHKSIPELLGELVRYINCELAGGVSGSRKWELEQMLDDCDNWSVYNFEIENYE